jgi:hypothetical protein
MSYVTNDTPNYLNQIAWIKGGDLNPQGLGETLPEPVNDEDLREDNPNMVRISDEHLILYYVILDKEGGKGSEDIWFSESFDKGETWQEPVNVADVNTTKQEDMPFYYSDQNGQGWLYFTSINDTNDKMEIFRAKQISAEDYLHYSEREAVIGAGNAAAVAEPTLTWEGDISFVVLYDAGALGTDTDRYDVDPWYLAREIK